MNEKKGSKISRETERHQRQFLPEDDDSAQDDMDSLADACDELFETALSRLGTIRVPGKGKLNMNEAMEASLDQYEVFLKWCQSGKPIREIIGWLEGNIVFQSSPPIRFKGISFDVTPEDAVLQITTPMDEDQVVLCNIRLENIGPEGLDRIEPLANGQQLVLKVTRGAAGTLAAVANGASINSPGELEVIVTVDEQRFERKAPISEGVTDVIEDDDSETDINKQRMKSFRSYWNQLRSQNPLRSRIWNRLLAPLPRPLESVVQTMLTMAILVLLIIPRNQTAASFDTIAGPVQTPVVEQTGISPSLIHGGTTREQRRPRSSSQLANNASMVPIRSDSNVDKYSNVAGGWHLEALVPALVFAVDNSREATGEKPLEQAKSNYEGARQIWAQYSSLERLGTFATRPDVTVRFQATTVNSALEDRSLELSFARAFEASQRFRVLGHADRSRADVVIGLRYERSLSKSGFVFVDIRDSNGKFIWQDFTQCQESSSSDQSAIFTMAAERLVGDLEKVMDLSNQSQKNAE